MKDYLNYRLDEPDAVSDTELRQIVRLLLEHLNLDAVRVHGEGAMPDRIELEKSE